MSRTEEDASKTPPNAEGETNPEDEKKAGTLKERVLREALTLLVVLVTSVCFDLSANLFSPDAGKHMRDFNARVVESTKDIGPLDMANAFNEWRNTNRYGWRFFSFKEPFNVTAALNRLQGELALRRISQDEYARRKENIEWYAFVPEQTGVGLNADGSLRVSPERDRSMQPLSTLFGIPDGIIHAFGVAFSKGWASLLAYSAAFLLALAIVIRLKVGNPLAVILASVLLASVIAYLLLLPIMWAAKVLLWFLNMPQTVAVMTVVSYPVISLTGKVGGKISEHYFQEMLMKFVHRRKRRK